MSKKLNTDAITNELAGSAFFPRPARVQPEENTPTPLPEKQITQERQPNKPTPERMNARTPVRPNSKRIRARNAKEIRNESNRASMLASNQDSMIEKIRKSVKSLGKEVSFTRLTPEEKGKLADIVYTFKRQGIKTTENEINRIAINSLIEDFYKNGKESVLAQVIEALNA